MSEFFIRRPTVAVVLALFTMLGGLVALTALPIAQFPAIIPPQVVLSTTYAGADAVTVEQAVATPIEQQMNGVDRMLYIQSTNASDGSMLQRVTFDIGTNVDIDNVLAANRYAQAQTALPQDVKNFGVTIKKSLAFPLLVVSLTSSDPQHDAPFLANYATINLVDALLRVPGVGDVKNLGAADYSMRIWVKPDLLARLGLTVDDIRRAIVAENVVNPAGQIGAEPAPAGQAFTFTVRAQGRLTTPEEFGAIIVRAHPDGSQVRVRDVARVELGTLFYKTAGAFRGRPAAILSVYQLPGSNALDVADHVALALDRERSSFPAGVRHEISLDTTRAVREGMREIQETLLEAIVLVVGVVFVFLKSWRATLIPLCTVPVSLLGTIALFPLLGFSINSLTLFGLVLAVGLVVDDAIVVVEAVEHHIAHGMAPKAACQRAMREVAGPVVGVALVLCSVFLPIAFAGGISGLMMRQFALTQAVAVAISAFNALSLSPALAARFLRPPPAEGGRLRRAGLAVDRALDRLTQAFVAVCRHLTDRPWAAGLALVACLGLAVGVGRSLPTGFIPAEDNGYVLLSVQLPDAASLQRTRQVFDQVAAILDEDPRVSGYNEIIGYNLTTGVSASYMGSGFISLLPWGERRGSANSAKDVVDDLNRRFATLAGARVTALGSPTLPGLGSAGGISMMVEDRQGTTFEALAAATRAFVDAAQARPEVASLVANFAPGVPQLFIDVDKEKTLKQGISLPEIYSTLQAYLGGIYVNDFTRFGRQWKVFIEAEPTYRLRADDLTSFYVRSGSGAMVPLTSFADLRVVEGPEFTTRFNLYRSVEVVAQPARGYSTGQAMAALEAVAADVLPEGMGHAYSGLAFQEKRAAGGTLALLGLSVLCVFLVLAALYESWSLPISVLMTTPVAVCGAFFGLAARGMENNVYAQIGLVMLVGLAAKNAILIVEFARRERALGKMPAEAALSAARARLRPILMTALAFILGCLPLWSAAGAGASARRTLGTVVIAGAAAATFFGLFLVPAFFVAVERLTGARAGGREP